MFIHTVFDLLKKFSPNEIKRLDSFLKSPYHNKSRKVTALFSEIKRFYPEFTSEKLTKEKLSLKISPDNKFNDLTLRDLMSGLLKCIEEFLIYEELNKNYPDRLFLLLKSYTEKNQETLFDKIFMKISSKLESGGMDSVYFYNKSLLDMDRLNFNIINKHQKSAKVIQSNEELRISYVVNILIFYITELINTYIKIAITESKFKSEKTNVIPLSIIKRIDPDYVSGLLRKANEDYYIIEVYSNLLHAFQNLNSKNHFLKYKSSLFKYSDYLSRDEISYHFSMLISFCILSNSLTESKNHYDSELLKIYDIFLKGKYFCDRKTKNIDEDLYRNILILGLRLKKFNWVLRFIKNYSNYLHPGKKENLLKLSYAEYYYYIGSIKKSFNYLKDIQEETFILKYDIKSLYLILYYDLHYDETVIIQLNNYKKFLNRNKLVTKDRKERIIKFLNIFEKLVYFREGDPQIKSTDLHFKADIFKDVNYRDWLYKKIEEISISH